MWRHYWCRCYYNNSDIQVISLKGGQGFDDFDDFKAIAAFSGLQLAQNLV
jgi:hypothetical protein